MPDVERENVTSVQPLVKERPTDMEIPPELERGGVAQAVPSQFKGQVNDDFGKPLIQTPPASAVTIQVPASQQQLEGWSKGDPENALTWFAVFWIRLIKKALHFSWRMVKKITGGEPNV
ncbi:MAG: hypothetical protein UT39_C0002G0036 [Candidatus Woesebacteria bacterium GW2011_GWA1_39_21]|uniref:Uncharacterized protein n=1 Tax=Candidatus Woesebacteria bacterium GW2011_GWA1_39_21 TaxID=1618550 RepID=A0A0G0QN87_9BACT|nr:MAG: hypothetical protein UT39_C0002G0036 [Candidatus Woesebacteria bacterium GW2011_GWA1_39_21]